MKTVGKVNLEILLFSNTRAGWTLNQSMQKMGLAWKKPLLEQEITVTFLMSGHKGRCHQQNQKGTE